MKPARIPSLLAIAGSLVLLVGCGSSSKSKSASAPASPAPASTTTAASAAAGAQITSKHNKLGTILAAGSKKKTVYLFEADKSSASSCSGACAKVWPPVTTDGQPSATGAALSADLGTTMRSDGTKQVTYKGHPLYFFVKDGDAGDAYGEGSHSFGAGWYVLKPNGAKIDKS